MYCKFCGTELRQGQKFCEKCGQPIQSDMPVSVPQEKVELSKRSNSKKKIIFLLAGGLLLLTVVIVIIFLLQNTANYNQSARNFTYSIDSENHAFNFSCDLNMDTEISNQQYDIDDDGEKETLRVFIEQNEKENGILVNLQIQQSKNDLNSTYEFSDTNYYISLACEGEYYLYKSDRDTYVVIADAVSQDGTAIRAAGIIGASGDRKGCYSVIRYKDGTEKYLDNYTGETLLTIENSDAEDALIQSYNLSALSNLRVMFTALGLKGFLTGTDDINNIMNYSDLTLIGNFTVEIEDGQGSCVYSDLLA